MAVSFHTSIGCSRKPGTGYSFPWPFTLPPRLCRRAERPKRRPNQPGPCPPAASIVAARTDDSTVLVAVHDGVERVGDGVVEGRGYRAVLAVPCVPQVRLPKAGAWRDLAGAVVVGTPNGRCRRRFNSRRPCRCRRAIPPAAGRRCPSPRGSAPPSIRTSRCRRAG